MSTTPCEAPNKLWPGVKCTKVMNHEGLHHGTNSLGVMYEWKLDFETLLGQREHVHPHPNVPESVELKPDDKRFYVSPSLKPAGIKPTVGRIVHYTNLGDRDGKYPPEVQAALITKVVPTEGEERTRRLESMGDIAPQEHTFKVSLCVFYETGYFFMQDVPFTSALAGTEAARGKWAWPKVER